MSKSVLRWSFYLAGIFILALGVTLMLLSNLGSGGWDALVSNLSKLSGLKVGNSLILLASVLLFGASILERKKINITAFAVSFVTGKFIDFWFYTVFKGIYFENFTVKLVALIVGVVGIAIGCAMMFVTHLPKNHTETFIFALGEKFGIDYGKIKTLSDSGALVIALILGMFLKDFSNLGLGTVLNTFFTGYLIKLLMPGTEKIFKVFLNRELTKV